MGTQQLSLEIDEILQSNPNASTVPVWAKLLSFSENYDSLFLRQPELTFGRLEENDVHFAVPHISGRHCRLFCEDGVGFIEDTSSNGTYLNAKRIGRGKKRMLTSGDVITLLLKQKHTDAIQYVYQTVDQSAKKNDPDTPKAPEERFLTEYQLGPVLGAGSFAEVRICLHKETGEKRAVKMVDKQKFLQHQKRPGALMDEVAILQHLSHEHIVSVVDAYDGDNGILYIVQELATGGDLLTRILDHGSCSEEVARDIMTQLLHALAYLHSCGIAHRDLKPDNILIRDKDSVFVKITDFGLSRIINKNSFMKTICGTPEYLAPEICSGNYDRGGGYTELVDIWSLGVIMFVLLSGEMPFFGETFQELAEKITHAAYGFNTPAWQLVSPVACDLIQRMLQVNPADRVSAVEALEHPWITGLDPQSTSADADMVVPMSLAATLDGGHEPIVSVAPILSGGKAPPKVVTPVAQPAPSPERRKPVRYEVMVAAAIAADGGFGVTAEEVVAWVAANYAVQDAQVGQRVADALRKMLKKGKVQKGDGDKLFLRASPRR